MACQADKKGDLPAKVGDLLFTELQLLRNRTDCVLNLGLASALDGSRMRRRFRSRERLIHGDALSGTFFRVARRVGCHKRMRRRFQIQS